MATRLFVGNLPENTSENDLRSAFSPYGEITTLDLKSKSGNENKKFAFVTLSGSNYDIESCITHFGNENFHGNRLYVTRARESFLERLQREREQAQKKETEKLEPQEVPKKVPIIKLGEKLNPRKRKFDAHDDLNVQRYTGKQERIYKYVENEKEETLLIKKSNEPSKKDKGHDNNSAFENGDGFQTKTTRPVVDKKKQDSEMKRMESMKKKRQEFKQKQMIIKTGLTAVDKVQNKKIVFSDNEDEAPQSNGHANSTAKRKGTLFDDDDEDSGDEVDFAIKEQFEGRKGQKVLDLQSRYKSDKRFTLDERFIEDEKSGETEEQGQENENIDLKQKDEKNKQLDILQDLLGITLKRKDQIDEDKKNKPKLGMLRFDPTQPEHARFLAPVEQKKPEPTKKGKKKNKEKEEEKVDEPRPEEVRPEVSKEQFYKVSETLKEAIAQPNSFSLRSLFGNNDTTEEDPKEDDTNYILLEAPQKPKVKNPLEGREKNPFVYDSSESENEDVAEEKTKVTPDVSEPKAVWKENLFFSNADQRLKEGLAFFNISNDTEAHKERRELKSLVKKRIYNKERKNQMFQKKIGGRRKTMKKSFRKKTYVSKKHVTGFISNKNLSF